MLQSPVQLPPLALSSSSKHLTHDIAQFNAIRFQKDSYSPRPAYQSRMPAPVAPLSIPTGHSSVTQPSSPNPASAKHPRSPYISSRPLSGTVPVAQSSPAIPSALSQCASLGASSTIEDVLAPGDVVGEGLPLQNDLVRLVSSTPHADGDPPAQEFEVVRRLGAGSYAVVYLVREVLSRPVPSEDGHMSTIGAMEIDGNTRQAHTIYGREFAIKLLSKANLDEEALEAQMSEVRVCSLYHVRMLIACSGHHSPISPPASQYCNIIPHSGNVFFSPSSLGICSRRGPFLLLGTSPRPLRFGFNHPQLFGLYLNLSHASHPQLTLQSAPFSTSFTNPPQAHRIHVFANVRCRERMPRSESLSS